jgi:hypothetical protein
MNYQITEQKAKQLLWKDESGAEIPYKRIKESERLRESKAFQLAKQAVELHDKLKAFKIMMLETCNEVVETIRAENKIKTDSKGNYTWYNFDHSIKIEVNVNDLIRFDETLIDGAKEKLMQLIDENISGDSFIKGIIAEAFQTRTHKLDTRRILGLKRYTSRIINLKIKAKWNEAMELIEKSIRRPESRTYLRVFIKDEKDGYTPVDLNFSSIK